MEDDDYVEGEKATFPLLVKENGIQFAVYLNDGAMVGVFLDQREVRKRIMHAYSEGKTVLNTFSYTELFQLRLHSEALRSRPVSILPSAV